MKLHRSFIFYSLISLSLWLIAAPLFAVSEDFLESKLQAEVKKMNLENIHLGIAVERTNSGKVLYSHHGNRSFIPASNNKIFTAIATLFTLPENFRYKTQIYGNESQIVKGDYRGNLYIKFSGDPTLTTSRLVALLQSLKQKGINKISGNIYLVANDFTGPYYPIGWGHTDMNYCYAPPISTLNLNRNCFVIELIKDGKNTRVKRITNTQFIDIENTTWLASYNELKKCQFNPIISDHNNIDLKGCLPDQASWQFSFAIKNPALKMKEMLPSLIEDASISFSGKVYFASLANGVKLLAETQSDPLDDLLAQMLQHSDNLYAETFARSVGLEVLSKGTVKAATTAIRLILESKLKVNTTPLQLEDGSGLSTLDLTSPDFMVDVLTKVYDTKAGKTLFQLLPTSGKTGTLAYRMGQKNGLLGRVHAKTGTLNDSSTLSGYVLTKRNHLLSFSIMINGLKDDQRKISRRLQDKIVYLFYQYL